MSLDTLWQAIQVLLIIAMIVVFVLVRTARRNPHVEWLQAFNFKDPRSEERQRRARHTSEIISGVEIIGMGLAAPPLYLFSTVFMFENPNPVILTASIVFALGMVFLGIRTIVKAGLYR
jgi:hypothetical protein